MFIFSIRPTTNSPTDKAQAAKYNGMIDCVTKIIRQEGFWTLYQGLESTMWRHVLWNSGYFGCIFQVRALLPANPTKDKSIQMRNDLLSGSIGGTVGTILNTPMDVVKSRIQNSPKVAGGVPKYGWAWPALGLIMKEEGFGALYKGFLPKVLRLGPGGGILLVVFTGVMVRAIGSIKSYEQHANGRRTSSARCVERHKRPLNTAIETTAYMHIDAALGWDSHQERGVESLLDCVYLSSHFCVPTTLCRYSNYEKSCKACSS